MDRRYLLSLLLIASLIGCRSAPSTFDFGAYSEAERFYQKGQYQKAIGKYEEYLREHREGNMVVIANYYMAKSYEEVGHPQEARKIYQEIAKKYPKLIWADFAKARLKELGSEKS